MYVDVDISVLEFGAAVDSFVDRLVGTVGTVAVVVVDAFSIKNISTIDCGIQGGHFILGSIHEVCMHVREIAYSIYDLEIHKKNLFLLRHVMFRNSN